MAYDIGPKIGIDGEAEFRRQIQNINQQVKTLNSEMGALTAEFEDNADSQEFLTEKTKLLNKQIDAQEKKVSELRKGLDAAADKYGENDTRTLKWKQAVNEANASLSKMKTQLAKTGGEMDDFGDETGSVVNKLKDLTGIDLGGGLGAALGVGGAVVGIKELAEGIVGLEESTREYRSIMGTLEVSSARAGYTAEETAETYKQLYGVLGDAQTTATATANLQALGLSQEQLTELTNGAIGAWATYGDSIPIDGLSEAINETIQAGKVTGTFADVLNWAGTSEDEFNEKLAAANSSTERAQIVLDELAKQGLTNAGEAWKTVNGEIVAANEAQNEMEQAMGRLGEVLSPIATALINFTTDALGFLIGGLEEAIELFKALWSWKDKIPEVPDSVAGEYNDYINGSHASGLNYVPFDGYIAELHRGEMVLPASFASSLRSSMAAPANNSPDFGNLAAGIVNGVQTAVAGSSGGTYTINLMLPSGEVLARYQLPALIDVARANGTPILNPN